MNKKILLGIVLLISLTACKKEDNEIVPEKKYICNEISTLISEYEDENISFKEFKEKVSTKYNEICVSDNTEECEFLNNELINSTDQMLDAEASCNFYKEQEMIDNCINNGESFEYLEPIIKSSQDNVIFKIKEKCGLVVNQKLD